MNRMVARNTPKDAAEPTNEARARGCWYQIDTGAIRDNYRQLRRNVPSDVKIFGCLKRNAYGCGAGQTAMTLAQEGIDGFAVSAIDDAVAIRRAGVSRPILLYPGAGIADAPIIEALDLTVSVSSIDELRQWRSVLPRARAFIKLDLGFFRAGVTPARLPELLDAAECDPGAEVVGIYAHMSELPSSQPDQAQAQLARMHSALRSIQTLGHDLPMIMMSSTEGVLSHPEMDFDAVDPGALLFGIAETTRHVRPIMLQPALMTITARLVSVKRIDASLGPLPDIPGMKPGMVLGVLAMGWGDGLPRETPCGSVGLVRGQRARLIGPAHLEHIRIDLTGIPDARFGDEVVLLGRQGKEAITHAEIMSRWNTDLIGLYAGLRDHVPRVHV
ncbi:alanine racemase [Neorhizobium sp. NCHU2750]|uniref:alanine racemase n=1 Tax=Neorhizobium sp. NCHU2750 TaxID=1825976 RepID=UPI000EB6EE19|nr:alanine racemase [Neorhizobium sp. NCHU2750]